MKIFDFVKALLPRIERSRVLEDLRITQAELDADVVPTYKQASEHFKATKMRSDAAKDLSLTFYRNLDSKSAKRSSFVEDISSRLTNVVENCTYISQQVEAIMEQDILRDGLTAKKTTLLRAAEAISFISRYSLDLLNFLYVEEAKEVGAEIDDDLRLSPATVRHVQSNIAKFAGFISDFGIPNKELSSIILAIPEVVVNDKTRNSLTGIYKEKDLDPLSSSYVSGFTGSPIFHLRMVVAEWQASRYKANKDKKKMLELRLLHLKLKKEGKNDPKLEEEIIYIQSRVDKISRYMTEVETQLDV